MGVREKGPFLLAACESRLHASPALVRVARFPTLAAGHSLQWLNGSLAKQMLYGAHAG